MIPVTLNFSLAEAKSFFESAGLEVKQAEIPVVIGNAKAENLMMWVVTNPHTGKLEHLDTAFLRCVVKNKIGLVSDIEKLEIINSFK